MGIPLAIVAVISDVALLLIMIAMINITAVDIKKPNKMMALVSLVFICISGIVIYVAEYSGEATVFLLVASVFALCRFPICVAVAFRKCTMRIIYTVLIVQFVLELLASAVKLVFPDDVVEQLITLYKTDILKYLIPFLLRIAVLISLVFITRKKQMSYMKNITYIIPMHIYVIILISCVLTSGLIAVIGDKTNEVSVTLFRIRIFAFLTILCFVLLLVLLLTNVLSKRYYNDVNRLLEEQVQTQLNHYSMREKTNAEIRRFKHDYNNHISCIKVLLDSERYDDVADYLNRLSDILPSGEVLYNTGNYLSDAILSDKSENARVDDIEIVFNGTIPTFINNTDLCIILSNALDNAIEACRAYKGDRKITVFGGYRHGYFILTVKNPTVNRIADDSALPATTKADKLQHGFGLVNINAVVEKYDGAMRTECKDGQFVLSLTFNSGISE